MHVEDNGVAVEELIDTVKRTIKAANISATDSDRDLEVGSVVLTLNVVATRAAGGSLDFRIPIIGMQIKLGTKLTRQDTHTIEIKLTPPVLKGRPELRAGDVEAALLDAVSTIRRAVASAALGDDPFVLAESTIDLSFVITAEGTISLGVDGELTNEVTHTLRLGLVATT